MIILVRVYTHRGLGTSPTARQHNIFDSEKLSQFCFLVLQTEFKPRSFGSRVRRSTNWATAPSPQKWPRTEEALARVDRHRGLVSYRLRLPGPRFWPPRSWLAGAASWRWACPCWSCWCLAWARWGSEIAAAVQTCLQPQPATSSN